MAGVTIQPTIISRNTMDMIYSFPASTICSKPSTYRSAKKPEKASRPQDFFGDEPWKTHPQLARSQNFAAAK